MQKRFDEEELEVFAVMKIAEAASFIESLHGMFPVRPQRSAVSNWREGHKFLENPGGVSEYHPSRFEVMYQMAP